MPTSANRFTWQLAPPAPSSNWHLEQPVLRAIRRAQVAFGYIYAEGVVEEGYPKREGSRRAAPQTARTRLVDVTRIAYSPSMPSDTPELTDHTSDATEAEALVRENIGWMLALAERLLRDRALAEDAVQEAFIAAFRGLDDFEGRSTLRTWLHRITVNASLTKLRQQKRRAEQPLDDYLPEFDQFDCRVELPWSTLPSLQDVVEKDELRRRISECVDRLPDGYRTILRLRDFEGYDTAEVADLLQISEANVKVRLHRARSALKKLLEPILRGEVER